MKVSMLIAGDYKGKGVNPTFGGKVYILVGIRAPKLYLNKDTVESYELITEEHQKSAASGVVNGLVGGALLGPVGMLAGVMSAKSDNIYHVAVQFRDGKRSLIEFTKNDYKIFTVSCFASTVAEKEAVQTDASSYPKIDFVEGKVDKRGPNYLSVGLGNITICDGHVVFNRLPFNKQRSNKIVIRTSDIEAVTIDLPKPRIGILMIMGRNGGILESLKMNIKWAKKSYEFIRSHLKAKNELILDPVEETELHELLASGDIVDASEVLAKIEELPND